MPVSVSVHKLNTYEDGVDIRRGEKKYAKNQNAMSPINFKLIQVSSKKPQHFEIC